MTNYENQWEGVVRIDLDRSFRLNDKLLKLSSLFIQQNPLQLKKTIETDTTIKGPAVHITGKKISDVLSRIHSKSRQGNGDPEVFVLGRYNHTDGVRESYPRPRVAGMTVHRSKGLEADYVIVSDLLAGKYGFPTQIDDDPILSMLLMENEAFPNSEERRLFYVAITRARKEVWLLEPKEEHDPPSEFLVELTKDKIYQDLIGLENLNLDIDFECPRCKSPMQRRINKKTDDVFLGCMHFPRCDGTVLGCPSCNKGFLRRVDEKVSCSNRDCNHVPDVCPACEDGILVLREGPSGSFIGCSLFPDCEHTKDVN